MIGQVLTGALARLWSSNEISEAAGFRCDEREGSPLLAFFPAIATPSISTGTQSVFAAFAACFSVPVK